MADILPAAVANLQKVAALWCFMTETAELWPSVILCPPLLKTLLTTLVWECHLPCQKIV